MAFKCAPLARASALQVAAGRRDLRVSRLVRGVTFVAVQLDADIILTK